MPRHQSDGISQLAPTSAARTTMLIFEGMLAASNASLWALAAVTIALLSSWGYEYVTMPTEQKNAPKLRRYAGSLPILGDTLTLYRNVHRFHDLCADNSKNGGGVPIIAKVLGSPSLIELVTPQHLEDILKTHFDALSRGHTSRRAWAICWATVSSLPTEATGHTSARPHESLLHAYAA